MPRNKSSAGYTSTSADPPDPPTEETLLAQLRDVNTMISAHQELIRTIPLKVLKPQVDEALGRVRARLAALSVTPARTAPILEKFPVGKVVAVEMSPLQRGIVIGTSRDPETGKEVRLLLLEDGRTVSAAVEELQEAPSSPEPETSPVISQIPRGPGPETVGPSSVASSGIKPGDTVSTPMGEGRVTRELPGMTGVYEITGVPNSPVYLRAEELKVVTPPTPSR